MYNDVLSIIGLLAISTMIIALPVLSASIGPVNAQNIKQEEVVSQGTVEDKIIELGDSFKKLLIITPNAQGSDSEENGDECENELDCSNGNLNEDIENKEIESTTDILLPFP
ncbi:MAG: hypothetical protein M3M84_03175 [Thermoproteota archaeon]|jgi:hypothetical protein|nr:hypothetical protein [Thermoproteota archaeon]